MWGGFTPSNLEAATRSYLIYGCKEQDHFSHKRIKTKSVGERCEKWRGCLNISLMNDKPTLKQFSHFSLYLTMSSIFIFKVYSVSKIPRSPATFYISMPNIRDGVNISVVIYSSLQSEGKHASCLSHRPLEQALI